MRTFRPCFNSRFVGVFVIVLMSVVACDVFQDDPTPQGDELLNLTPNRATTPGTPFILDLKAAIQAEGDLEFVVEEPPSRGTLDFLSLGILKYTPNDDFESGLDRFAIAVYAGTDLLDVDTTVVEVSRDAVPAPCLSPTLYGFFEVPLNGSFQFDPWLNAGQCSDSARYRGFGGESPENGTVFFVPQGQVAELLYVPNPGYTGLDTYAYDLFLTDLAGNDIEIQVLAEFDVQGSEDFLPEACKEVWPNQLVTFDTRPEGTYEVQVEFPADDCNLPAYTLEIVNVSVGTAEFEEGHIIYTPGFTGAFAAIEYTIDFGNGDILRRRLQIAIDNSPG